MEPVVSPDCVPVPHAHFILFAGCVTNDYFLEHGGSQGASQACGLSVCIYQ